MLMRIKVAEQRPISIVLADPVCAGEVPLEAQLRTIHLHSFQVPGSSTSEIIVSNADLLEVADFNGFNHELVGLISFELILVGLALLQMDGPSVVLFPEKYDGNIGIGAGAPFIAGDHMHVVRCCGRWKAKIEMSKRKWH